MLLFYIDPIYLLLYKLQSKYNYELSFKIQEVKFAQCLVSGDISVGMI